MLYQAIFLPEGEVLPRDVIYRPEIYVYIKDWGKEDDLCLVAEIDHKIVGAVWTRILDGKIKGYGNIDSETPEFAISLLEEYRNLGIGTRLMNEMIEQLKRRGYKKTSLSVAKENYALKLYQNVGFEVIDENEEDYLMLLVLNE
ncbi:GNAT family N-acetyltransferase [Anaerosacchariphilus polymeriproducens]|uniref:GNAT family N-acetyltransferase n=1 Tax=Anaerosacchariphilus polymeriproducens TaxID=1812858 RepID=A0A371ASX7_9FIRM|nr:GNAT family N-acetyltransferase [Anaerosacchariphilus polymeriproducens]RDU22668.1 GNAT family N-acetyltransferase [Anaerosacchariphilus polymeriproducens]